MSGGIEPKDEGITRMALARHLLIPYIDCVMPWFVIEEVHCLIAEAIERCANGENDRLMLWLPPRAGKSTIASVVTPSWWAGRWPSDKIMQVGYKVDLPRRFSRQTMNLMRLPVYREIFPGVQLTKDAHAAGYWRIEDLQALAETEQGEYQAAGVLSGIAGSGFHFGGVDDPLALHVDTPIPTPRGFVRLTDLKIGDCVFGPDGLPTTVTAKSEVWDNRPLYRVVTSDKQSVLCDGGHRWPYMSDTSLRKAKIKTAKARDLVTWSKASLPCLPRHAAVQYPECELPIEPWVLGAWLGDGTASLGRMTCHPDDMAYMRSQFEAAGYPTAPLRDRFSFAVRRLRKQVRLAGLLNNKHIPEAYFTASVPQRMALLQGLMDTDGCVSTAGQCSFGNTNRALVEGVVRLLHSLGLKAQIRSRQDTRGRWASRQRDYSVAFKLKDAARMPRKAVRTFTPTDKRARSFTVEPTGDNGAVQCITVARRDGLFLCGRGYVVTHNSEQDKDSKLAKDRVWEWWGTGFYTRRQPERNIIILTATRWAKDDLPGRLLAEEKNGGDKWEVVNVPALLDGELAKKLMITARDYGYLKDPRKCDPQTPAIRKIRWLKPNDTYAPRRWTLKELMRSKANMRERDWNALYMGNPQEEEGAILLRRYWRLWKGELPLCHTILQFYDTAFEASEKNDHSACTTWGIFEYKGRDGRPAHHAILLGRWKKRVLSPELPKVVIAFAHGSKVFEDEDSDEPQKYASMAEQVQDLLYGDPSKPSTGFKPDKILIENKASGQWLWRELRKNKVHKVPAYPWNPPKGDTGTQLGKYARAMKGAMVLERGCVWYQNAAWADEVINECAECKFDGSDESDDLPDTVTMALLYFRQHFLIEAESDIDEEAEAEADLEQRELKNRRLYG